MPVVTEIRRGPRGSRHRRVFVDGEEWRILPAEVVQDVGLREGAQVLTEEADERIAASLPVQAWERTLRLLNFRERGSGELERRLADDGYPESSVRFAVDRARDLGFLDDRRFADSLVRGLADVRGLGRRRVASQLSAKGVDEGLAAEMLADHCSEEAERERALVAARRLLRSRSFEPAKLASRLVTRGFSPALAFDVARGLCVSPDGVDDDA